MKTLPIATILMAILVVIASAVGGAVVIWGPPGALSFHDYLNDLKAFAFAVAGLGGARGLVAAAERLVRKPPPQPQAFVTGTTTASGIHGSVVGRPDPSIQVAPPKPAAKKPAAKERPPKKAPRQSIAP